MTRGNKQRKSEEDVRMKRQKLEMEMVISEEQRAGKRFHIFGCFEFFKTRTCQIQ
ncbi:hypothetical protein REPUB_Repub06bG0058000 [Reevesia pubescens]